VNSDDILAFARRDWQRLAEAKTEYWLSLKRSMAPDDVLALCDDLRKHARSVRPDWPSESDRADDLAVHVRVSAALRDVSLLPGFDAELARWRQRST
jgi:hypothetical protein